MNSNMKCAKFSSKDKFWSETGFIKCCTRAATYDKLTSNDECLYDIGSYCKRNI